jgi:maltodextrin utilization protein YvdJ
MFSPKWGTLLVLFAIIYASRDRFQIPNCIDNMVQMAEETVSTTLEKRQLVTGFIQAESVLIRPVTDPLATHAVSFSIKDLARLASFSTPAPSGIVHFTGRTLKFFQVITDR